MPDTFLEWSIALLEEIEASPEKQNGAGSILYMPPIRCRTNWARLLHTFMGQAYKNGLVITNYRQVIQRYNLEESAVANADSS